MTDAKLKKYRAKRDFKITAEPSGARKVAPGKKLRFVIQKHDATRLHFDLRLEVDGVFKSWAVTRGPSTDPADKRLAVEVEDHPLDYGDFEGTIPKGQYGGGTVQMWDRGYWAPDDDRTPQAALKKGDLKFTLEGKRLRGSWALVRMKRREGEKHDNWLLIKHKDDGATKGDGRALAAEDKSVASGRTMAQIAAGKGGKPKPFILKSSAAADAVWNSSKGRAEKQPPATKASAKEARQELRGKPLKTMPEFIEPQLCRLLEKAPSGPGWAHEVKLDGYRMQMRVENGDVTLRTRKGLDWTEKFKAIAKAGAKLPDCIIDGEIVALGRHGAADFAALQDALSTGDTGKLAFFAFDALCAAGKDLRALPLVERKAQLKKLLAGAGPRIRYVAHVEGSGADMHAAACKIALEGIVSKRLDAPYRSGRGDTWTKVKCRAGQEVIIGGWTEENGRFRSLLVGANKGGEFIYMGRVGTGFGQTALKTLLPRLKAAAATKSPFDGPKAPPARPGVKWAKPKLVADVHYATITNDGLLRQASYQGLREDKPAKEVVPEHAAKASRRRQRAR